MTQEYFNLHVEVISIMCPFFLVKKKQLCYQLTTACEAELRETWEDYTYLNLTKACAFLWSSTLN